ncbi:class I mannose-6-phosphate isomerase [Microlunatus lacustris]
MSLHPPRDAVPGAYDKAPTIALPAGHRAWAGAEAWQHLAEPLLSGASRTMAVDTYPGTDVPGVVRQLRAALPGATVLDVETAAALSVDELEALLRPHLTDDRVFATLSHHVLADFYHPDRLAAVAHEVDRATGPVVVVGWGAALVPVDFDQLVLADLARWEIQQRQRAGASSWRAENAEEDPLRKVKRGYFVEWRVADRHKRTLLDAVDHVLDLNGPVTDATLVDGATFRLGLELAVQQPFRVVPFFDPGVWGGQWMREAFDLADAPNYAWCFDCVPEENSILLQVGEHTVELPALDVVLAHPRALLGEQTYARFGAEFPIRFDFLDTVGGQNLSLQVHPLTDYIFQTFGAPYTQDESYYLLDAGDDAVVYLGLRTGTDPEAMATALRTAAEGGAPFDAPAFVNTYPARRHDHFSIPAGTVHCSGADAMVLEISATPYLFTFKMWDWGRVGLDGRPRPIHLDHALANIQWDRDTAWTDANLVGQVEQVGQGEGWVEERTGLHALEFIEVRRHWFEGPVPHHTEGTVNVLNLVQGSEAVVESPDGAFDPFVVHFAETFIVPAAVGPYVIRPHGAGAGQRLATVKATVRGTAQPS